jgi:hypothetical protein
MEKQIRVTCDPEQRLLRIPLDELHEIQGELKTMTEESYRKFSDLIEAKGIWFATHVWKEPLEAKGKKAFRWCIVDGTGRKRLFGRKQKEGWLVPPIPCVEVVAKDLKEAKEAVLAATSRFHETTNQGLYEFMGEDFTPIDLERFELSDVDMPAFKMEFFDDSEPEPEQEAEKETVTFDAYKNAAVKQVVLYYAAPEYETMVRGLDRLMSDLGVEDYSQVLWRLVDDALRAKQ